jgi:serine/threonine protein kinase
MANPTNSNPGHPFPSDSPSGGSRQETLLISDVPNATALTQDMNATQISSPTLSAAALAALSQRYDILGEAGHGAMGNVYKARDRETGETVALKLLKPEIASDQAMMDRFKNELLFARKITHKNVCRVHEFNRIDGIAYTSMEFVEGESLRSVLNRFGGFPLRKGIDLALQICSGLKEAHAQGIVHRDLKPENVMIDTHGNVKIMDFGIARSMEALTRLTGAMIGTPAYMAPEQVAGKPVDYRTDIYSLGLILYEMFTGSQAFQADTAVALALKQMRETPPAPHDVDPTIPVTVERAILKCLEKEPSKRFQSVAELETVLRSPGPLGSNATPQASVPASHSIHATPIVPLVSVAPKPEPNRTSPVVWILLGALLAVAAWGGMRAKRVWDAAEQISPPAALPAPAPPVFALDKTVAPTIVKQPAPVKSAAKTSAKNSAPALAKSEKPVVIPSQAKPPVQSPSAQPSEYSNLSALQQRSERILQQSGTAPAQGGTKYLWVGRYSKEDMAQKAAKKIKGLGLNATVVPRQGIAGDFFVVLAGPFGGKTVSSVSEWLETQGFKNVRPVNAPTGNSKSDQNSKP